MDCGIASTKSKVACTKHVRFASLSENLEVPDTESLTEQEMNAMHMTQEDQKRTFVEISETLAKAGAALAENLKQRRIGADTICDLEAAGNEEIRGLECIVQKRNSNRGKRMKAAVNAVMKRQAVHGIDEAWIISDYRPLLEESKKLARERGLQDEVDCGCGTETSLTDAFKNDGAQRQQQQQ